MYTSFTRCTENVIFENNEFLHVADVAERLHTLDSKFNKNWAEFLIRGTHIAFEQLDCDFQFQTMAEYMSDRKQNAFLSYHMENTMYDWNFLKCGNCEEPATSVCTGCYRQRYCGIKCQQNHWCLHQRKCIVINQTR